MEVLPNAVYRVELANGHRLVAHVSRKTGLRAGRMGLGAKVTVQTTPYDLSQGCIK